MAAKPADTRPVVETVLLYLSRILYRIRLLTLFAFAAVSLCWLYWDSGVNSVSQLYNGFASTKGRGSWGDNWTQSEWAAPRRSHLIPPKIWQIMLPKGQDQRTAVSPDALKETATWLGMNPGYAYTLVGEDGGRDFIAQHFGHNETIASTFEALPNVGMKSDLLRYLILDVEGGVYTDTDTLALKPIDDWVPAPFRNETRLIVGIEFDQRNGGLWADIPHALQFCQWTIAAAPGHPVFQRMVSRVITSLGELVSKYADDPEWTPTSLEVMNSTGPAAWTDVVWEYLQETDDSLTNIRNLSSLGPPRLFRDALVLPIDGFGVGQPHSGSTNDGSIPDGALVKHLFGGSWRGGTSSERRGPERSPDHVFE